jgi:hypothetical protein
MSEHSLAADLDRALAGEPAGDEAQALAALLVAAAAPSSFQVDAGEVEDALARARRVPRRRRRHAVRIAAVAAAAAGAALLLFPHTAGYGVQARAAVAVDATYFVDAKIVSAQPRLFPATEVTGFVDGRRGRAHVEIYSETVGVVAETVLHPNGRVDRWLAATNTTTIAPSCDVLPGGCGETLDPIGLYVRSVQNSRARVSKADGGYVLRLRVGRIEQVVRVSGVTYLPRSIEWRQDGRLVATIRFTLLQRQRSTPGGEEYRLSPHPGARVVQLTRGGRLIRIERITPTVPSAGLRWLGPVYHGARARVDAVRLTGGRATRITYGRIVVWNYGTVVPPPVLQRPDFGEKVFAAPGGHVVHAYFGPGRAQVALISFADRNVAIVSTAGDNIDVVRAVQSLTRRGSP